MRVIGLTGSIACGKSTISRYLVSLGYPVVDGDQLSRDLTAPGSPVLEEIRHSFGDRYMNDNGNLNRRALGQLIFRDEHARSRLDAIMAPHLMRMTKEQISQHRGDGAILCFLDMPLLYEKGYDRLCDSVWTVWLPENVQLSRLIARDHLSEEDAIRRIRSVMSSDEKASRANYVIDNSGSVRETLAAVDKLLQAETEPPDTVPSLLQRPVVRRPQQTISSAAFQAEPRISDPEPEVMDRPVSARRQPSSRKAAWKMSLWLKIALIASAVLFAASVTATALMSGYLKQQEEKHRREQEAVSFHYHFEDFENEYRKIIEKYAGEFNLKPAFVAAVIMAESSFRPVAVSDKAARGMMQLLEGTASDRAKSLGIRDFSFDMAYDPDLNIRLGCCHLQYLVRKFGDDLPTVMVAYNVGEGNVARNWLTNPAVSSDGRTIQIAQIPNNKVREYVKVVAENYGIYQEQFYANDFSDRTGGNTGAASP